ncbi:hypothetical protein H6P87_00412 [Rickettsia tillamookensis]|uniref:Fido domain-containing protein n=1 Tax=Rickettsia tillamookensis TaxID=2761623 RepID=A0A9E6MGZ1_9RICK|nr:Fic family protein [Rickettsia tillamookensis]QQV74870.1 hypothetical protein H6P87_00412 [Rickettsia tillamookensis]
MSLQNFRIHKRLRLNPEIVEEIYTIISEIEGVKNSWQITKQLLPQTLDRLTRSVIITSTGSSNRIEGNKLTDDQVENLYRNLNVRKFKTRDEQEIAGYLQCLELIFDNYKEIHITESFILKLHSDMLVYSDKDMYHKGNYKFASNRVEAKDYDGNVVGVIFEPTPPYLVKKEIQELIDWYNLAVNDKSKHSLILIANFIFEYLAIHPFQDGNGQTSRLLTNLLLLKHGYLFTQIVSHERIIEENKIDYYKTLNKTQRSWKTELEDITDWLKFFLNVVKLQTIKALQIIKEDNIEYLLSEKQLAVWNWINKESKEFSRKDAVDATGFPKRTIESIIKKLVDFKRLERIGQGKATRYKLK